MALLKMASISATVCRTCGALVLLLAAGSAQAQLDENQLKAAFLYNFARFVEWPPQAFKNPGDPIVICALGQSPLMAALQEIVSGKVLQGRSLTVRQVSPPLASCGCQILFIRASDRKRFKPLIDSLKGTRVLSIGEYPGFAAADGGVMNLKLENGKIRFEINVRAAEREQLHISSKLLSLAEIVRE